VAAANGAGVQSGTNDSIVSGIGRVAGNREGGGWVT